MDRASATDLVERGVDVASSVAGRGVDVAATVAGSVLETAIDTASEVIETATDAVQRVIDRRSGTSGRRISARAVLAILAALGLVGAVVIQRRRNRAAIADHAAAATSPERPNAFAAA
jgi:hypothetical protein